MKILVVSNYYPPYYFGGYELACKATVDYLTEHSHQVYILCGDYCADRRGYEIPQPMHPLRLMKYINYLRPNFVDKHLVEHFNYYLLKRAIEDVRPDVVYFWNLKGVSIAPVIAVQDLGVKVVFEIGDFWPGGYLCDSVASKMRRYLKTILPFTIGGRMNLTPVIAVSEWVAREMREKYGSKDVYVVSNGVVVPHLESPLEWTSPPMYMFSGRLDPQKGIDIAINAFGLLKLKHAEFDFQFDIFGEGKLDYKTYLQRLIRKYSLEKQIRFFGRSEQIYKQYRMHHCLLMPTMMREPFGLVIIEAMANSMNVIASNHYGPSEIIEDGVDGDLFEPGSVEGLAEKIYAFHNNPQRYYQIAVCARRKVVEQYDLNVVKPKVEQILKEIVHEKQSAAEQRPEKDNAYKYCFKLPFSGS